MASRPPPSLRPSFNVGARLMEREVRRISCLVHSWALFTYILIHRSLQVISLLDDDELDERKSASTARRSRPSLPVQGRRVSSLSIPCGLSSQNRSDWCTLFFIYRFRSHQTTKSSPSTALLPRRRDVSSPASYRSIHLKCDQDYEFRDLSCL